MVRHGITGRLLVRDDDTNIFVERESGERYLTLHGWLVKESDAFMHGHRLFYHAGFGDIAVCAITGEKWVFYDGGFGPETEWIAWRDDQVAYNPHPQVGYWNRA